MNTPRLKRSIFTPKISRSTKHFIRLFLFLFVVAGLLSGTRDTQAISPDIVISQVYGGGGNSGATYTNDFIELFNRGTAPVNVAGWSVQYASSSGSTWQVTTLSGTIQPGQYFLVQEAAGSGGTTPLPTPDVLGSIAMSASSGKVVVASTTTAFSVSAPSDTSIVDVVGYGTANFFEGSGPAPVLSNTTANTRAANGCQDTDDNAADFTAGAPNPRNTASPLNPCSGGPVDTAPSVASITPANGAANVALDANIEVTFSEDVNVTGSWVDVSCTVSGVHTTTVSGGLQSYTLDPDTDFVNDETCTVTIFAAQVTDVDTDDPPDNMDADFVSSFSTETAVAVTSDLILTGVVDGPLPGGVPKAVELFVLNNIADLSIYGVGSANNGGGTDGQEFTFPAVSATAGSYIYIASEATGFTNFFGFAPNYTSGAANINGDDAIELFKNGVVVDVFGEITHTGTGLLWNYLDGWASRVAGTGPDGSTFVLANWIFSGPDALDGETSNATAANPFPIGFVPGQPLPLSEGFDDCTLAGWEIISVDTDTANTWVCSSSFSNIEANGFGNNAPANEWLITPPLNLDAQENDTLTFRSFTRFTDIDYPQLSVLYSTDYNGNGDPTSVTWTELSGITFSPEDSNTWTDSGNVDLSGISGVKVYIAFQYTSSGTGNGTSTNWRVDAIEIFAGSSAVEYKIHEIQGSGLASPLDGAEVIIEGIVVGDFQDSVQFSGFHVQEEDSDADADPNTSEGIFVYHASTPVAVGDLVRVTGTVDEFNGLTEITNVTDVQVLSSGNSLPAATAVTLPVTSLNDFEKYEGMLVTFPQTLTISEFFNFDRFGEIVLSTERQFQPTAVFEPGSTDAANLAQANVLSRITLDDGRSDQNPDPARHPNGSEFTLANTFRGGDTLQNVTGIMDYAFGAYKIQPTAGAIYTSVNPRPSAPDVGGDITVASFNVLNYFTTLDYPPGDPLDNQCGPLQNQECRGADADQPDEFTRQRDKIIATLVDMNADVVGLIEIENHPADVPTADLVSGLNDVLGAGTYDYIATGAIGSDAIRVALIYKPASVTPVGSFAILDSSVDSRFLDDFNRPTLAQSFQDNAAGGVFTVAVNHLKSKGSNCNAIGDPDLGDGAGNCNLTRLAAAEAMVDWLASDPTGSGDNDFLIIGDLNSYDKEDPIDAILAGGYTDLLHHFAGEYAYSYVFDGQLGYLDHALASSSLLSQVTGTAAWHANSDEPDILDYDTSFKQDAQDALYEPNAYRASDHDPVIIGLDLSPYTFNPDGCIVLALEGSPFTGAATAVSARHGKFSAAWWARSEGLPLTTCFEIHGTDGKDIIVGAKGDDTIFGYGGKDILFGGFGNDSLFGGDGDDILFGERGDYDYLDGGDGNDILIDPDGVSGAHGGAGNDIIHITLHRGWRDANGDAVFANALSGGYDNDHVTLIIKGWTRFLIDVTGDERDDPPAADEGNHDFLKVHGRIHPNSVIIKFEHKIIR